MRFTLEMEPDARDIEMAFSKWARLIDDFGPVFQDVVKLFRKHEARQFSTEGKATGGKWTALSPAYATWKKKNFPGRPILQRSGALLNALARGGPGSITKIGKAEMVIGLDSSTRIGKYGEAHSRGVNKPGRPYLPPRPPVRWDPTVHTPDLKKVGRTLGGEVPLGTAIAQLFQVYIVRARKKAHADKLFSDRMDWQQMRRGVLRLRTR